MNNINLQRGAAFVQFLEQNNLKYSITNGVLLDIWKDKQHFVFNARDNSDDYPATSG